MIGLKRHIAASVVGGIIVLASMMLWQNSAPVVWFVSGDIVEQQANRVRIDVSGIKVRDCRRIPDSEVGYVQSMDGRWHESLFAYVDDLSPNSNKPAGLFGRLSFGIWEWSSFIGPVVATMTTVEHDCSDDIDDVTLITTRMGPFPL